MKARKNSTFEVLGMLTSLFLVLSVLSFFVQGTESIILILRFVSIFGVFFSVVGLILLAKSSGQSTVSSPQPQPEEKSIFVEIHDQSIMHTSPVIDLEDLDDLIRLAKQHGTAVFHLILNFIHLYYVRGVDNVTYRYVLSTGTKGIQEKDSTDETLENTLPRHFTDNNPFNLPRSLNDFEEMKKDSDKGETHLESYRETQSHNSENAILKTSEPDLDNHLEYVISAVRIEFTEPNR